MVSDDQKRRRPGGDGPKLTSETDSSESDQAEKVISPRQERADVARVKKKSSGSKRKKSTPKRIARKPRSMPHVARMKAWVRSHMKLSVFASILGTLFIIGLFTLLYFVHDLPDISGLAAPRKNHGIHVLANDGSILANYGDIYGEYQAYSELPKPLIEAVVATEDRNFFHHYGIDPMGIIRAMVVNVRHGGFVQGGSTITQQLAKNIFLTPDRTLKRKFQEMLLAFWLEHLFTKQEILSIYLNRVYLGSGNFGVDAAAHHYFGIPAKDLTLSESAIIAGLLKAPSRYAPTSNPDLAIARGKQVILNMEDAGYLTKEEAKKAFDDYKKDKDMVESTGQSARYFTDWVVDQLPEFIGNVDEDIVIETTLDPKAQEAGEKAIAELMVDKTQEEKNVHQAALMAIKPNGEVVAMIGGLDYFKSQYNRAVQAKRQPGSSFKMFVYLTAMENGYNPDMTVMDEPIQVGKWRPGNYTGRYLGLITIRDAVAQSINTVAVLISQQVGIANVINTAKRLGIQSPLPNAPSLALGSAEVNLLELTTAYAHLASNGKGVRPYGIKRILRKNTGDEIYKYDPPAEYIVINPNVVAMMNSMLSSVIEIGTARGANIGRSAAGKTGTTSDYKDAWFIGYTPTLATGVWVGNDDSTPMKKVTGGQIPARIWSNFMRQALVGTPTTWLPTQYTSEGAPLPWNMPKGLFDTPNGNQPQPSGDLSPTFWDKLFNDKKVEYEYPNSR
ncbi:MAG: PBP1A family penicillin-binding protein [Rickettsiales bacterium]